ncbi:MAG TPA: preprotein translocase subunit SecG [Candidatus Omnitrophica bacterium]|nr:preprotein translocase subunit SecG [Candidatus Omnitrophota bacterium]
MILFVSIVHVIVCLLLLGIILLQPGKGMGLSSAAFGGTDAQSVFGTKTADVLTKATTVAAVLFIVTCITLSAMTANKSRSLYSKFQNQAPITMEQIQKAVKEAEENAATQATTAVAQAETTATSAAAEVQAVVDQAAGQVAEAVDSAPVESKPAA